MSDARERLAQLVQEYADIVDSEVPFIDNPLEIADAILAAGFGDVAEAKAAAWDEAQGWQAPSDNPYRDGSAAGGGGVNGIKAAAWDEGHDVSQNDEVRRGRPTPNPYRTTDTNGVSATDPTPATFTGIPACALCEGVRGHWLGCPADEANGASE